MVIASKTGGRDVVDSRLDPLNRQSGNDRRDNRGDVTRVYGHFVAEATANITADDANLALGYSRQHCRDSAHEVRCLRSHVYRQLAAHFVERRDAAARLEGAGMHSWVQDLLAHRDGRALEYGVRPVL